MPNGRTKKNGTVATGAKSDRAAILGFEAKLWAAADALRNNMDAAEYKHVVLGLIFLKYISDAFEAKHAELALSLTEHALLLERGAIVHRARSADLLKDHATLDRYIGLRVAE